MAFPSSPTNGQTATINGIVYTYNSTDGSWVPITAGSVNATVLTTTGGTVSTLTVTGAFNATLSTAAQPNITSIGSLSNLIVSGNVNAGTIYGTHAGPFNGTIGATTANTAVITNAQITSLGVGTGASGTTGQILATNSITAYYSDQRLKTITGKIENALDKVDQLNGILYVENDIAKLFGYDNTDQQVGVIAQEVQIVQPEAIALAPFDRAADGSSKSGENYLTVCYEKLVPLLIEAVKELRQELNTIKKGL
jgi:hypothetical protein